MYISLYCKKKKKKGCQTTSQARQRRLLRYEHKKKSAKREITFRSIDSGREHAVRADDEGEKHIGLIADVLINISIVQWRWLFIEPFKTRSCCRLIDKENEEETCCYPHHVAIKYLSYIQVRKERLNNYLRRSKVCKNFFQRNERHSCCKNLLVVFQSVYFLDSNDCRENQRRRCGVEENVINQRVEKNK